jgi:hypothetical protein
MPPPDFVEYFPGWPRAAVGHIGKALADGFEYIGAGGHVQQALIGFGILDDGLGLALNRKHYGPLAFLEMPHEIPGSAPKCRERLNVLGDIDHGRPLFTNSTFLGAF